MVELLFGLSTGKPQYALSVCQEFARALEEERGMEQALRKASSGKDCQIFMYSCRRPGTKGVWKAYGLI